MLHDHIRFGEKSLTGTGGMESKVKSSLWALDNGCGVVICNGMKYNTIRKIMRGQKVGSFFTKAEPDTVPVEILAKNARKGSRRLQSLSPTERAEIITNIGDSLTRRTDEIININSSLAGAHAQLPSTHRIFARHFAEDWPSRRRTMPRDAWV